MFKKLRKWYFKLYHLFRFLGIFILIFGIQRNVYAEECTNILNINEAKWYIKYVNAWKIYYSLDGTNPEYINYKANTNYAIFFANTNETIEKYLCDNYQVCNSTIYIGNGQINIKNNPAIFNYIENRGIFLFDWINSWSNAQKIVDALNNKEIKIYMVEGNTICTPEEEQEQNEVYSNFLTIYIDRIGYLANGFTSNPYLIAMIGIIFAWVVLEFFLKILHLRGGKYK